MTGAGLNSVIVWGLASLVIVVTFLVLVKVLLRAVFGWDWAARRVRVPWRFSLSAVAVLTAVIAVLCGVLRDSPELAAVACGLAIALWFPLARFLQFRDKLADRRNRTLADSVNRSQETDQDGGSAADD